MRESDGMVEVGSRYDLRTNQSPNAPETERVNGEDETFGWVHSYETGSTVDGPGVRLMLFMSGCFLRCQYCHNPDTWRPRDGTKIDLAHATHRLADFAPALLPLLMPIPTMSPGPRMSGSNLSIASSTRTGSPTRSVGVAWANT